SWLQGGIGLKAAMWRGCWSCNDGLSHGAESEESGGNEILCEIPDFEESRLTRKEKKRKIKQATVISQISTGLPPAEDDPVIGFRKKDLIGLNMQHNDALIISIQIAQAMVNRIHADEGSAVNILQLVVIHQIGLETKINKLARSLTSFNGATMVTMGTIYLDVYSLPVISWQTFIVIDEASPYNDILGKPLIGKINAITSATH
ncbi:unnamed protein product, partial [Prunus brigantina]